MINKIEVQNFKCLLDVRVDLGPFNVLIGPNDSGKTSFLEVIGWLTRITRSRELPFQEAYHQLTQLVWRKENERRLSWSVSGDVNGSFEYFVEILPYLPKKRECLRIGQHVMFDVQDGQSYKFETVDFQAVADFTALAALPEYPQLKKSTSALLKGIAHSLTSTDEYHLSPRQMRLASAAALTPRLSSNGNNLAGVLHGMLIGPDRQAVVEMERQLAEAIPTLRGFSTPPADANGNMYSIEYTLAGPAKPPITIPASQVSDGAMLLTAFLALAYGDTPQILLVEEPENGLHPSMLKRVIEILRKMSTGKIGNQPRQVVLTTHSPLLLNYVEPDEVRIFRRTPDGGTQVTRMSKVPNIEALQKEFAPGELWYLLGEEKLVEAQPA
jgi:predicted ATPase